MITTPASTALLPTQAHLAGRSFLHGRVSRAVLISRRSQPLLSRNARRSRRAGARAPRAGLLDLFTGGGAPRGSAQKDELVEQLYDAVKDTDAGLRASPEERERIEELVEQLSRYSVRAPTRSDLFYGDFEIAYCSKPSAPGGPFRSLPGRTIFAGQRLRQSVSPGELVNIVEFKTLGFLPGATQQPGQLKIIDGQRYQVSLASPKVKLAGGGDGAQVPGQDGAAVRTFRVLYLDEIFRVVRFEPEDEDREPVLFVFQRIEDEEDDEDEDEEEEEEEEEAPVAVASGTQRIGGRSRAPLRFGLPFGRKAEEEVDEEEEEEEEDDEEVSAPVGKGPLAALFGVAKQPQPKPAAEGVEDARAARQAEAESKRAAAAEAAARKAELQEEVSEYAEEAETAAVGAKQVQQALKGFEKEASGKQRAAAKDRARLMQARAAVEAALADVEAARRAEQEAVAIAKEAAAEVRELEKAVGGRR